MSFIDEPGPLGRNMRLSVMDEIYSSETLLQIMLVTGLIGGGAAWLAGRAIAQTWRPFWHVLVYMAVLGAAVRFIHFALFAGNLLEPPSYAIDTLYLVVLGSAGWRVTRTSQMVSQYPWLYERTGPLAWRERPADQNGGPGTTNMG